MKLLYFNEQCWRKVDNCDDTQRTHSHSSVFELLNFKWDWDLKQLPNQNHHRQLQMRVRRETITSFPNTNNHCHPQGCGYPPTTNCDKFAETFAINVTIVSFLLQLKAFYMSYFLQNWVAFNNFPHRELLCRSALLLSQLNLELPNDQNLVWIMKLNFPTERIDFPLLLLKSQPMDRPLSL